MDCALGGSPKRKELGPGPESTLGGLGYRSYDTPFPKGQCYQEMQ